MSNRKESLKKSLGITEYPWSSDDEDNPRSNQEPASSVRPAPTRYRDTDSPPMSGSSGAGPSVSAISPTRRNPTRLERDLYWSLHNNPNIINVPVPPSRSHDPEILAFTRLTPNLEDIFWSASGEENSPTTQESGSAGRRRHTSNDPPHSSVTAGSTSTVAVSPTQRNPTQMERMYWSESNQHGDSAPSRSREPPETRDLRLMQAINRLTRNFCRHPQFVSSQRGGASRSVMFNPSMQANVAAALGTSRIRRRPSHRAPPPCVRSSIIPPVMDEESSSSARTHAHTQNSEREQNFDDDPDPSRRSTFVIEESNENNNENNEEVNDENNTQEQENMDMDTSEGVQLEDVVEVDGGEENGEDDNDNENDVEILPENEEEPEEPVPNPPSPEAQTSQTIKRRRESRENVEPETVKEFNKCLLGLLECPVCLEWMEPPMSQCRRGHLVCGRCRARLAACPVCRTAFSSVRNRAMEAVAELLRYPCRHECGRDTQLRRRAAHEASCAARRYRCPASACAARPVLPLADLAAHFQTEHASMLKLGRRHAFSIRVNTKRQDNWLVLVARDMFHLRVDVDVRAWGVAVFAAYVGPKCNAGRFVYEVTVTGEHNNRKLVYTRATHSDLETSTLNVTRQDCFHLPVDQVPNFLRLKRMKHSTREFDKFLDFVVEINKREELIENVTDEPDS